MRAAFKELGFNITAEHSPTTDFLDVVLCLKTGLFKPFRKDGDTPNYIHVDSNHPPNIIKQLPAMIQDRLSVNSSNEELFNEAATIYNDALERAGYKEKLMYKPRNREHNQGRVRRRNIIWWNPPYNASVSTNITRIFFAIVNRLFTGTTLGQLFNKNNLKVSYRTGRNFRAHLDGHNKSKLANRTEEVRRCNCTREPCPLEGQCGVKNVIYRADVTTEEANNNCTIKTYFGQTTRPVKDRITEHKYSFSTPRKNLIRRGGKIATIEDQIEEKKNKSELANYVWKLKQLKKNFTIKWKIEKKAQPYRKGARYCNLCALEKTCIALGDPSSTLNSRNEIFHKCRSKTKFTLQNFLPP